MPGRPHRRWAAPAAVVIGVAVAVWAVFRPWYLNYDARYALLWARDLTDGATPDYTADFAPTPHPLSTAWSLISIPFGDGGDRIMVWLALLAFGVVVYLAYKLGEELLGNRWIGVVAALVVVTRPALLRDAVLGYQDVPFAALVLAAVLVEARRPRNGYRTLGLLVVAGLLRPEAWLLGGLYWLYLLRGASWRDRVLLAGLVWLAPAIWALGDLLVTGDALHSLHGTSDLAAAADRRRRFDQVPFWTAKYFGYVLREPSIVAIPLGLFVAWKLRLKNAWLPLAVAGAMVLVFAINPAFGLPLIGRYVRTPSVLLALFYGLAVAGVLLVRKDDARRRLLVGITAVSLLATVAYLPFQVKLLSALETRVDRTSVFYTSLRELARTPQLRTAIEQCGGKATVADYRPIPYLRYWLGTGPDTLGTVAQNASPLSRVLILPRRSRATRYVYKENFPRDVRAPAGWTRVVQNRSWRVVADPECA